MTLAGTPADLEAAIGPLTPGRALVLEFPAHDGAPAVEERTVWEQTFGRVPVGSSLLMADSEGHLSLADNQGDAARRLGADAGPAGPDPAGLTRLAVVTDAVDPA